MRELEARFRVVREVRKAREVGREVSKLLCISSRSSSSNPATSTGRVVISLEDNTSCFRSTWVYHSSTCSPAELSEMVREIGAAAVEVEGEVVLV